MLPIDRIEMLEKKTKPRPLFTEASLLSAMETAGSELDSEEMREAMKGSGIGTPATRAGIIELLIARGYIERKKRSLVPTEKGMEVFGIVADKRIADVEMTGAWESALQKIESGDIAGDTFSRSIEAYTRQIVTELLASEDNTTAMSTPCPRCKCGHMHLYKRIARCDNPDCQLSVFRVINKVTLSDEQLLTIINGGRTPLLDFVSKAGKPYRASLSLDEDFVTALTFENDWRK